MAKIKIGINGFGRIGRQVLKAMLERHSDKFDVVAINDLVDAPTNAHLFRYDSNYGRFNGTVTVDGSDLIINGDRLKVFAERDPGAIPWSSVGADIVIESTGLFTQAEKARARRRCRPRGRSPSSPPTTTSASPRTRPCGAPHPLQRPGSGAAPGRRGWSAAGIRSATASWRPPWRPSRARTSACCLARGTLPTRPC